VRGQEKNKNIQNNDSNNEAQLKQIKTSLHESNSNTSESDFQYTKLLSKTQKNKIEALRNLLNVFSLNDIQRKHKASKRQ
jgi:hypothetical protein